MIAQETIEKILAASSLEDVIGGFHTLAKSGKSLYTQCPKCGKDGKGKGLLITQGKKIFKCFSCDWGGNSAVTFLMESRGMKYPEALEYLANKYGIPVEEKPEIKGPQRKGGKKIESFRDQQLRSSGIPDGEQKVSQRLDDNTIALVDAFEAGTRDQYGKIVTGDDMLIWYYDLEGKPVMFTRPQKNKEEQLCRIRFQNPDLHKDQHGRPMKYSSPYGSGSHLYIPEKIRKMYQDKRVIKRLYLQEGEKKAEKACLHGLPSVGVMGIQNIGSQGKLPYEMELITRHCRVEEVVFMLDADWDDLSRNLQTGSKVDQRPWSFYHAVKNFREYFKTFVNLGIYLEIYFGYVLPNERHDKGVDDLLTGTLFAKEPDLYDDINAAINQKDGKGKYVQLHKITTLADSRLLELWHLQSPDAFAKRHKDELVDLKEFIIGKHRWRFNEEGTLEPAQALQEDEEFWQQVDKQDRKGNTYSTFHFRNTYCYNFLRRRGFGRLIMNNSKYEFCHIENKIVKIVDSYQIRDYMMEFSKAILKGENRVEILDFLYRGGKLYFGPDSLSNLDFMHPVFESADKTYQYMYFKDKYWKITADAIEEKPLTTLENYLWRDQVIEFDAKLLPGDFISANKGTENYLKSNDLDPVQNEHLLGNYFIEFSKDADKSHFVQFLWNSGEFFWQKLQNSARQPITDTRTIDEKFETQLHFVSKMTAIGYLLHEARDKSCEKAIIAMDGKISEVGDSNGRSGKSLLGFAISKLIPQVYISGKAKDLTEDPFIFEEVNRKTKNIFIDDVRANVDFEFFFPIVTGRLTINQKGVGKFTLPENLTPKLYITTNHAINGSSSSFRDRQGLIAFSDYYNDTYKPVDDFGLNFFTEWDEEQWNLFYNFIASCLQLYFKAQKEGWGVNRSGLIAPPYERLDKRRLRQEAGETFVSWADEYYQVCDDDNCATLQTETLNVRIERKELYQNFIEKNFHLKKYVPANVFWKKLCAYANYRGFKINPNRPLGDDGRPGHEKTGGVEYVTMANEQYI